ncbi:hypothetical protein [Helicobacter sp. NHP22-001]|uniref:hypothetical protein n=1 Tax=Helicobacter sp. NHP22-001 TaxID=3040202 RepID=UPI002556C6F1|nr:hypothetical protein [Helicobacter sp. NHP22-001]
MELQAQEGDTQGFYEIVCEHDSPSFQAVCDPYAPLYPFLSHLHHITRAVGLYNQCLNNANYDIHENLDFCLEQTRLKIILEWCSPEMTKQVPMLEGRLFKHNHNVLFLSFNPENDNPNPQAHKRKVFFDLSCTNGCYHFASRTNALWLETIESIRVHAVQKPIRPPVPKGMGTFQAQSWLEKQPLLMPRVVVKASTKFSEQWLKETGLGNTRAQIEKWHTAMKNEPHARLVLFLNPLNEMGTRLECFLTTTDISPKLATCRSIAREKDGYQGEKVPTGKELAQHIGFALGACEPLDYVFVFDQLGINPLHAHTFKGRALEEWQKRDTAQLLQTKALSLREKVFESISEKFSGRSK